MFATNRVLKMVREGKVPIGIEYVTGSMHLLEIIGWAGFDYVHLDMEHAAFSYETIESQVRTALGLGMTPIVRVAEKNDPSCILRVLETGAQGIVLPQVSTAADVRQALAAMRYAPNGMRSMCPVTRAARYNETTWEEYVAWTDTEVLLMPLIEDPEGIENIDEICAIPEVKFIGLGTGDLGQRLGCGARGWAAPAVKKAAEKLMEAAKRHQVVVDGMPTISNEVEESLESLVDSGFGMITYDADALMFQRLCDRIMVGARRVLGDR